MLLLEQDITRQRRVETAIELNESDGKEYKFKEICDSAVYARESESHLSSLYYLVSWKGYPKEKNTWEPALVVLHLYKLISTFHHDHSDKPIATSPSIDSAPPTARPTIKPIEASSAKQKWGRPAKINGFNKRAKKSWTSSFLSRFWPYLNSKQKILLVTWFSTPLYFAPLSSLIFNSSAPLDFHSPLGFSS